MRFLLMDRHPRIRIQASLFTKMNLYSTDVGAVGSAQLHVLALKTLMLEISKATRPSCIAANTAGPPMKD
jgi:hypothetical protein